MVKSFFLQVLVEKGSGVDLRRLISFVAIGVFMSGPGLHYWYTFETTTVSFFVQVLQTRKLFLTTVAIMLC